VRLFFAVEVPADVKTNILTAQERMGQELPLKGFKLTKPDLLHVTLAFVGDVAEENLELVKMRAETLAAQVPPVELIFERMGAFPDLWRLPKVLWVGVQESGFSPFDQLAPLAVLGRALSAACADLSDHIPEDKVLLHVTLARSSQKLPKDEMLKVTALAASEYWLNLGQSVATSVVLYESSLGKNGPVQHIPLARFPLKG
jgi:2'-5' RNA ligase